MNLPNKLTTLRVIMIPFFVFFLLWQNGENHTFRMIALALFIIASLTDLLDGRLPESTIWLRTLENLWIRSRTSF